MDEVDLVALSAEVGQRPVHHVFALRRAVDGDEDLPGGGVEELPRILGGGLLLRDARHENLDRGKKEKELG